MENKGIKKRIYFSLWDLFVVAVVVICFFVSFIFVFSKDSDGDLICEFSVSGEVVETVDLSEIESPYEYTVYGEFPVTFQVAEDGVRVLESQCPHKLCVNIGEISHEGQAIVCIPAKVSARLVGTDLSEFDAVVG